MLSEYVKTEDLLKHCPYPVVWSATTEPLQGRRQTISVMIVFTGMVQQHGFARMMVYGVAVYRSALQIQDKMV